jgi:hypothetical protein
MLLLLVYSNIGIGREAGQPKVGNLRGACVSCNDKMSTRNLYEFKHEGLDVKGAQFEWRDAQRARERAWLESQHRHKSCLKKNKKCAHSKKARMLWHGRTALLSWNKASDALAPFEAVVPSPFCVVIAG